MIGVAFDNSLQEGQPVYSGGCLVVDGLDLQTATLMSLLCDARAEPGDVLPVGTNRRGYWADTYDEDGDQIGSQLWQLESAVATAENCRRAEQYAQNALKWLLDGGHVIGIDTQTELKQNACWLGITYTLPNSQRVSLSPFQAF